MRKPKKKSLLYQAKILFFLNKKGYKFSITEKYYALK